MSEHNASVEIIGKVVEWIPADQLESCQAYSIRQEPTAFSVIEHYPDIALTQLLSVAKDKKIRLRITIDELPENQLPLVEEVKP